MVEVGLISRFYRRNWKIRVYLIQDLRQQQFEIKFRGYNPDDVEVFRDLAATALEEARAEVLKLNEENKHLNERLEHLVSMVVSAFF